MRIQKEFEELQRHVDKISGAKVKTITKNYASVLRDLRGILSETHAKYADKEGRLYYAEMQKYNRIKASERTIIDILANLTKENSKIIRAGLQIVYKESFGQTKSFVEDRINKTIRGIIKDEIIATSIQNPISGLVLNERLERNRSNLIINIRQEITQGLVKGESYKQMSDRIKKGLEGDAGKAIRIVRTESHRVMEDSKYDSLSHANKQGVQMNKIWLSSKDEKVRKPHRKMNNVSVPFDEYFILPDGARGKKPGSIGEAKHDVHCRCIFIIDVE